MKMGDNQRCPLCKVDVQSSLRYPNYLCGKCALDAVDEHGRALRFYNESLSGGFRALYADTNEQRDSHECYVRGVKCRADEARFGGIVIQPFDE